MMQLKHAYVKTTASDVGNFLVRKGLKSCQRFIKESSRGINYKDLSLRKMTEVKTLKKRVVSHAGLRTIRCCTINVTERH